MTKIYRFSLALVLLFVLLLPLGARPGRVAAIPSSVVVVRYGATYEFLGSYIPYGWVLTCEECMLGATDTVNFTAYKPTFEGSLAVYLYFEETITEDVHVNWYGSGWTSVYVMDIENIWTLCNSSPCDISGREVSGVYFLANDPAFNDKTYYLDAVDATYENNLTPTPTGSPTSTSTFVPGPTSPPVGCFSTLTPIATISTPTPTPFGAATSTPNATPSTLTPFPTLEVPPPGGSNVTEQFFTSTGATWHAEGMGIEWVNDFGHDSVGSIRADLSLERGSSDITTRLVYPFPIGSDWYLEFYAYTDAEVVSGCCASYELDLYTWAFGWTPLGGAESAVAVEVPADNLSWRLYRVNQNPNAAEAMALIVQDTANMLPGSYVWLDDFTWRIRGGGGSGGGDCDFEFGTPAPLPTNIFEPPCGEEVLDVCVGPIDDTTDICFGYQGFSIGIGEIEFDVYGVIVCLVPYAITSLSIAGQDMFFMVVAALTALPAFLMFQLLRSAR